MTREKGPINRTPKQAIKLISKRPNTNANPSQSRAEGAVADGSECRENEG